MSCSAQPQLRTRVRRWETRCSLSESAAEYEGRGPVEYEDFDDDKVIGGRLYWKTDAVGSLTVGASAYRGGYYYRSAKYLLTKSGSVDQVYTTISKYQEFSSFTHFTDPGNTGLGNSPLRFLATQVAWAF
jgi:hypothetical protein